jgi:hypothetical protein
MILHFIPQLRPRHHSAIPMLSQGSSVVDMTQRVYLRVNLLSGVAYLTPKAFSYALNQRHLQSRFYTLISRVPSGCYAYDYDEATDSYVSIKRRTI